MTIEYLTVSNWIHLHSATVDPGRCKSGVTELTILAAAAATIRVPAGRAFAGLCQRCLRRQPRSLSVPTDRRALQTSEPGTKPAKFYTNRSGRIPSRWIPGRLGNRLHSSCGPVRLGSRAQLCPVDGTAGLAAICWIYDYAPDGVADQADLPEDACPHRLLAGVEQDRADMVGLDESLERRDAGRRGLGEVLHRHREVRPMADSLGKVPACDAHVEVSLGLPEHAGVAYLGYHDDGLAGRQLTTVLP